MLSTPISPALFQECSFIFFLLIISYSVLPKRFSYHNFLLVGTFLISVVLLQLNDHVLVWYPKIVFRFACKIHACWTFSLVILSLVERSLTGCRGINTKVANEEKERYSKEPMRYQSKLKKTTISAGKCEWLTIGRISFCLIIRRGEAEAVQFCFTFNIQ